MTKVEHKTIASALAAAQAEMGKALKQSSNPHFKSKYADLSSVMDACLPALNANGIAVVQTLTETEMGSRAMVTVLIHESGEKVECPIPLILGKNDMQGLGSAITYARRYGLMSLAGIAPEDDDGNAAVASAPKQADYAVKDLPWHEEVLKDLPEGATDRDKAKALSDALIAQFKRKKSSGELSNEWDRRKKVIERIEAVAVDLHEAIVDAYESKMMGFDNAA